MRLTEAKPMSLTTPPLLRDIASLRAQIAAWRNAGETIGFVPTMGALHEGHLSLVRLAKTRCTRAVASIFVNPKQFSPTEDFARYPRDEVGDAAKLVSAGCDAVFLPDVAEMYPQGFATQVIVSGVSMPLEGEMRPHFFGGVATVVTKLLIQAQADAAFFGEKDYQQLMVIKRLARDLNIATEIVGASTVREADGLAMSSRNAYLSTEERAIAAKLNVILSDAIARLRAGTAIVDVEAQSFTAIAQAGFACVDYAAVRDAETLQPIEALTKPARILAAAWLGKTRLIDNMAV
jgi:pantoate--beta-alanine ligase